MRRSASGSGGARVGAASALETKMFSSVETSAPHVLSDRMQQIQQPNPHQEHFVRPRCVKCGAERMWLVCTEEQYPGYRKRLFECPPCGDIITQWTGV